MREIKFRCWFENKMFRIVDIDFAYKKINLSGADIIDFNEGVLMQYTGLKDKNGKEIYEGDIVKKLIWNELKFENEGDGQDYSYAEVKYIDELSGFHLVNKDNRILWELAQDKYNIEVVGNIWEDSDLLNDN